MKLEELINTIRESFVNDSPLPSDVRKQFDSLDFKEYDLNTQSTLHYFKAKLLQKSDSKDPSIIKELNESITKNSENLEALELLGEVYYEHGDFKESCNCFQRILNSTNDKSIEKRILRNLSISTRQLGNNPEERVRYTKDSLELAKKSLNIDLKDGDSWYVYGNSLLASYFWSDQTEIKLLQQSLTAYNQAELNLISDKNKSSLYFNRSVVFKYLQEYQKSLNGLKETLKYSPDWKEAKDLIDEIVSTCTEIHNFIKENKGSKKDTLVAALRKQVKLIQKTRTPSNVSDLEIGLNKSKCLICKAIKSVGNVHSLPQLYICVDSERQYFVVAFYNIPRNFIVYDTTITLIDPILTRIHVTHDDLNTEFSSLSVRSLKDVYFNGKLLDHKLVAKPELTINSS